MLEVGVWVEEQHKEVMLAERWGIGDGVGGRIDGLNDVLRSGLGE